MAQFSIGPAVLKKGVIFLLNQYKKYFMSVAKKTADFEDMSELEKSPTHLH